MKLRPIANHPYLTIGILGLSAAIALGSYLLASTLIYRIGFPLDDAWIHQTYARNLGSTGSWSFIPGQPSAGSTSPGWTLLLAFGYLIKLDAHLWTFLLGWGVLWILSILATYGFRMLVPNYADWGFVAGLLIIFEWHLTWAAGSGMETLLASLIAFAVVLSAIILFNQSTVAKYSLGWQWLGLGVLVGLGIWVRPDVTTLLGPVALTIVIIESDLKSKISSALLFSIGFLLTSIPYLVFNQVLGGEFFPNTYFAKQAEYAILRIFPIWDRYFNLMKQPLTGVGVLLLPGFIWFGYDALTNRKWAQIFSVLWILGYLLLFAVRLPVTYQHGRYVMPVIPVYCLFGLIGMIQIIELISKKRIGRIVTSAWILSSGVIIFAFWILGIRAYAMDVAVIESEMVETAFWIGNNTDGESLIAAHDIGALGYYANRDLLDLAGLVSPEVIPFIRDEAALRNHINNKGANYLVTFPNWYPDLVQEAEKIFQTDGEFSPLMGGENMSVYDWNQQ